MDYYRDNTSGDLLTQDQLVANNHTYVFNFPLTTTDYTALNISPVIYVAPPVVDDIHTVSVANPVQGSDGQWTMAYTTTDITVGMSSDVLANLKQQLCSKYCAISDSVVNNIVITKGFSYNFVGCETDAGQPAGIQILQMRNPTDLTNWLGLAVTAIGAIASNQSSMQLKMRTAANVNVVVTALQVMQVFTAAVIWKAGLVFTSAEYKDTMIAYVADATKTPADIISVYNQILTMS